MDVVIPYRNSASDGFELRYTLRGIAKFFPDLENIFIIGDCPMIIKNVIHIPFKESSERHHKAFNIYSKLLAACEDKRVSDSFAWISDDHFLLKPYLPDYNYRATLSEAISRLTVHQSYRNTLINTSTLLPEGYDYGHGPMIFEKEKFARSMSRLAWHVAWGYSIKSVYCGFNGIAGTQFPDIKIKRDLPATHISLIIQDRPYFSIDDRALNNGMKETLELLYPNKSIYEA